MILVKRSFNYFAVLAKLFIPLSFPDPHQITLKISKGDLLKLRENRAIYRVF